MDPELSLLFREYRFRKAFGCTHEEFLNQSITNTEWLLAIDSLANEVANG